MQETRRKERENFKAANVKVNCEVGITGNAGMTQGGGLRCRKEPWEWKNSSWIAIIKFWALNPFYLQTWIEMEKFCRSKNVYAQVIKFKVGSVWGDRIHWLDGLDGLVYMPNGKKIIFKEE